MDFDRFDGGAAAVNDHVVDNSDHDDVVDADGVDQEEEGDSGYHWVDGTPIDYLNWAEGEPNSADGNDNIKRCFWP